MDVDPQQEKRPYRETLDAAEIFDEISSSAGKRKAKPPGQSHGLEPGESQEAKQPETAGVGVGSDVSWPAVSLEGSSEQGMKAERLAELPPEEASPVGETAPGQKEPSIGELFSKLVKMSPPEKIRIEQNSIGSLFKKFITKRG